MAENKKSDKLRDKELVCQDCGRKFIFTIDEQKKFGFRGWEPPIRCQVCRRHKKILDLALNENVPITDQIKFVEICDGCGRKFFTKYKREEGEKVYCDDCWKEIKHGEFRGGKKN
jgi:hypothetical protein